MANNKEKWLNEHMFGYYNTEKDKGTGAERIESTRQVFEDWDDDTDDIEGFSSWEEYESALLASQGDDMSDEEADRHHANLYGGDRTYCDDCGTKLEMDEWGSYCPKCNPHEIDLGGDDDRYTIKERFSQYAQIGDALDEATLTEGTYMGIPGTEYISHGEWADGEISIYGKLFNYYTVEDCLWGDYKDHCEEVGETPTDEGYEQYLKENGTELIDSFFTNYMESISKKEVLDDASDLAADDWGEVVERDNNRIVVVFDGVFPAERFVDAIKASYIGERDLATCSIDTQSQGNDSDDDYERQTNVTVTVSDHLYESTDSVSEEDDWDGEFGEEQVVNCTLDGSCWKLVDRKSVVDTDGFNTEYSWYTDGTTHKFIFGDSDIYGPDDEADWECETEDEARDWFASYGDDEDEEDGYLTESKDEDIDKPFTKSQIRDELKRETRNWTVEEDGACYGFESEYEYAIKVLEQHYETVETDDAKMYIKFSNPKKGKKGIKESILTNGRYCIVARTNDGKFKFYKDGAFIDDYKEATIFTDMDEARAEWFDIDKSKYKRVFIPNYDESSFASLNENKEDDLYDYMTRQATGSWDHDDTDYLLNQNEDDYIYTAYDRYDNPMESFRTEKDAMDYVDAQEDFDRVAKVTKQEGKREIVIYREDDGESEQYDESIKSPDAVNNALKKFRSVNDDYGCDKCGMRIPQDKTHWFNGASVGLCDGCYSKLSKEEEEKLDADGKLNEKKQLNEGPGAGYKLSGKLKITAVESLTPVKFEDADYGSYDVTFKCVALGTIEDFEFYSYMYGDKMDSAEVEISAIKANFYAENVDDIEALVRNNLEEVKDCLVGATVHIDYVYGGGWVHSKFDGTIAEIDDTVKDSDIVYGDTFDIEVFEFDAKIKDTDVIEFVDKAVTGDNIVNEYTVFDSDDEPVDTFFEESDAINFAKKNNYARVDREEFIEKANGDQDFGDRETVWENDEIDVEESLNEDAQTEDECYAVFAKDNSTGKEYCAGCYVTERDANYWSSMDRLSDKEYYYGDFTYRVEKVPEYSPEMVASNSELLSLKLANMDAYMDAHNDTTDDAE